MKYIEYRKYLFYVLGHSLEGKYCPIIKCFPCIMLYFRMLVVVFSRWQTNLFKEKLKMIYSAFLLNLNPFSATYTPNNINIEPSIAIVVICSLITIAEVSRVTNGTK